MGELILERIVLAHRFDAPPGWVSREYAQTRRHHGFVCALEGGADYLMGSGEKLSVKEGDCLYVPRGSDYVTRCGADAGFTHLTVNFDLRGDERLAARPVRLTAGAQPRFEQAFAALIRHWSARHPHYRERCMGILYEMTYLALCDLNAPPAGHIRRLEPARAYLDAHFCEALPLESLHALCGLSATYFRRLFRSVYGETPAEYRRRLRIAQAAELILYGQHSMTAIAAMCGFADVAYFSRVFRQTMGVSPSRYAGRPQGQDAPDDPPP